MYAGSRPKSCDNKARYIPAQNSIQPLGAEAAVRHGATHLPSPRPMSSGDSGLHEMIPMAPEPASARDALREQLAARDRARAALFGAAAAAEAVEEEAVPEDAAASRASLMEALAARDRERADLVKILSPGKGGGGDAEADADAAARREARRAREADRQRRKEEKRRRERREAAKVAAAANVAAERSDDLLRSKRERKSQASLNSARGAAPLKSARGDVPPRSARGDAPPRSARGDAPLRSARGDAPRRPDSREVLSARNDVERAELWRELGDYANAIRSAKDADGAPTVRFPENYDEVVKLMNRRDLGEGGDAAGRSWAASSLRAGVGRACGSGDLARYKGVLDDGVQEERMVLGLATIERLDRELRRVQAKARAVRDLGALAAASQPPRLDDAQLAGEATDGGPGTARSLASSASDAVFLTEKRPRSKRSRFRDRNRAESPPKEDEKPATDFVLDNKHRQGRSLLTMEQEFRALHLALEGDAACDDVLEELAAYGGDEDELRRLADVDAQLRALGRADVVGATIPGAADRAKLVAERSPRGGGLAAGADDYLAAARADRAASRRELDVDKRLAAARGAPLVVLDDDDSDGDAPATAVRLGDVARLVDDLAAGAGEAASRERLDALLAAMGPAIATAAAVRDERRRRRAGGGDENDAPPPRDPPATFGVSAPAEKPRSAKKRKAKRPKARAFGELADALLESALRTKSALGQADDAIKRSLASKDVGAAFFDDDGDVGALKPPDDAGRRGAAVFDDDDDEA